jgi:tetratricopeptide (TPR) repeat protein
VSGRGASDPPGRLGDYALLGELARGGMGVVYRARHVQGQEPVALKALDPGLGAGQGLRRFQQEAQVLARLRHPNVLRLLDTGLDQGRPFLVTELVDGEDLALHVKRGGAPPWEWSVELVARLADALHYCHTHGVVHRDVKPNNILLERGSGRPVLADFGIVKRDAACMRIDGLDGRSRLTQSGELVGTPGYMAPEQVSPELGAVTPLTDVYALGASLYFLLTGAGPFRGGTPLEMFQRVLEVPPPSTRTGNPTVPPALDALCLQTLAKLPGERPPSAAHLAQALRALLPRPTAAPAGGPKPASSVPVALAGSVGLAGIGALAVLGMILLSDPGARSADGQDPAPALRVEVAPAPVPTPRQPAPPAWPVPPPELAAGEGPRQSGAELLAEAQRVLYRGQGASDRHRQVEQLLQHAEAAGADPAAVDATRAWSHVYQGQEPAGLEAARRALLHDPAQPDALCVSAIQRFHTGDVPGAQLLFEEVLGSSPDNPHALLGVAKCLGQRHSYEQAVSALRRFRLLVPSDHVDRGRAAADLRRFEDLQVGLSRHWYYQGRFDYAAQLLAPVLEGNAGRPVRLFAAELALSLGYPGKALDFLAGFPEEPELQAVRADALFVLGRGADARTLLERLGDGPPGRASLTWHNLTRDRDLQASFEALRRYMDAPDVDPRAKLLRALPYQALGRWIEHEGAGEEALAAWQARQGRLDEFQRALGEGQIEAGVRLASQELTLHPWDVEVAWRRATSLRVLNRRDEAIASMRALLELYPGWSRGWTELATMLFQAADREGCEAALGESLATGLDGRAYGVLASLREAQGRTPDALLAIEEGLRRHPFEARLYYLRAVQAARRGDWTQATTDMERSLRYALPGSSDHADAQAYLDGISRQGDEAR